MQLRFEWDKRKAKINLSKHGISFNAAQSVFTDDLSIIIPDPDHAAEEERSIIMGISRSGHMLVVCFVERDGAIRLISARRATRAERDKYEQTNL